MLQLQSIVGTIEGIYEQIFKTFLTTRFAFQLPFEGNKTFESSEIDILEIKDLSQYYCQLKVTDIACKYVVNKFGSKLVAYRLLK